MAVLAIMPTAVALGIALAIGGATIAPALTVYTSMVGRIVPAGMRNEANLARHRAGPGQRGRRGDRRPAGRRAVAFLFSGAVIGVATVVAA